MICGGVGSAANWVPGLGAGGIERGPGFFAAADPDFAGPDSVEEVAATGGGGSAGGAIAFAGVILFASPRRTESPTSKATIANSSIPTRATTGFDVRCVVAAARSPAWLALTGGPVSAPETVAKPSRAGEIPKELNTVSSSAIA